MNENDLSIQVVTESSELEKVHALLRLYTEHLHTFLDRSLLQHRAGELSETPPSFLPPLGALLLASRGKQALGCVGLRNAGLPGDARVSELCRLFVVPTARGLSVGWRLMQEALALARERGDQAVVLYSIEGFMDAAKKLYLRAGFRRIPAYKDVSMPHVGFYRLDLR